MADSEPILPLKSNAFKESLDLLFSYSNDQLSKLLKALEEKKTLFSTAEVAKLLSCETRDARQVRAVVLTLVHALNENKTEPDKLRKALDDANYKGEGVDFVMKTVAMMSAESISAGETLYEILAYTNNMSHLGRSGFEVSHAFVSKSTPVMFPLVRLSLSTHTVGQQREFEFSMDANELEEFIMLLNELLKAALDEGKTLKQSLGDKFTALIGERS